MINEFKIAFLFSGQGSQARYMGQKIFDNHPVFRASMEHSHAIVQQQLNRNLIDELYRSGTAVFDDILVTHPAIVAVELAMYELMTALDITCDYVLGNSLGEFAAGVVAGIWTADNALEMAIEQAKSISRSNDPGVMLSVICAKDEIPEALLERHGLFLATDNFEGHFTVSGSSLHLDSFLSVLEQQKIQYVQLPVKYPFHSPLIERGCKTFDYSLAHLGAFPDPGPRFISGLKGEGISSLPQSYFSDIARSYIDFPKAVNYMEQIAGPFLYIDLGPSGTLATFVKYNLPLSSASKSIPIMTPYKREAEQLEKLARILNLIPD